MEITNRHLSLLLTVAQETGGPEHFVLGQLLLQSYTDVSFRNKACKMMGRRPPENWSVALAKEFIAQCRLLLWILGPIWMAMDQKLPSVSGEDFINWLEHEPHTDWDEFFRQFGSYNHLWQECVNDALSQLKINTSKFIVGRIVKFWLEKLPEPLPVLTPSGV